MRIAFWLLGSYFAALSHAQAFSGAYFLESCIFAETVSTPKENADNLFKRGYCFGAVGTVVDHITRIPPSKRRELGICLKGDEVTSSIADLVSEQRKEIREKSLADLHSKSIKHVATYLKENLHLVELDRTKLIVAAFAHAYPCPHK